MINWLKIFFYSLSIYSVQYLGWVTAIVAAILTLTTIIFSQYNERSINKSNDIAWSIQELILRKKDKVDPEDVIGKFNNMLFLLSNRKVYLNALRLFGVISVLIVIAWLIGSIGYGMDADNSADKWLILISTLILEIPFVFLPFVITSFNKSQPLLIKKNGQCTVNQAIMFFRTNNILTTSHIVNNFVSPTIRLKMNREGKLILNFNQLVTVGKYNLTYVVNCKNSRVYFHFNVDGGENNLIFSVAQTEGIDQTHRGLFENIKKSGSRHEMYFFASEEEIQLVFEVSKEITSEGEVVMRAINPLNNRPLIKPVKEMIEKKSSKIRFTSDDGDTDYLLSIRK